jgi:hypothetical protein
MPQIYQLKIMLFEGHIQPPIWRRVTINGEKTLFDLHYVIQGAMGWQCSHLYAYYHADSSNKYPNRRNDSYADLRLTGDEMDYKDDKLFKIKDIFKKVGDLMFYEYDFGDSWEHSIRLEVITETDQDSKPACINGERNCPPEDCGGLPGYFELVEAVKNPKSQEAKEFREWLGETYNPEKFNLKKANHDIEFGRTMTEANMMRDVLFSGNGGGGLDISTFMNSLISGNENFQKQMNRLSVSGKVFELKISVQGLKPEVSRTIEVEPKLKFRDLMKFIRASFGWLDGGSDMGYYFIIDGKKFGKSSLFNGWYSPESQKKIPSGLYDDSKIKLSEVFTAVGEAVNSNMPLYAWKFRIKCEAIKDKDKKNPNYPVCVAGKGNITPKPTSFKEIEQYIAFIAQSDHIPVEADLEKINRFLEGFRKKK